MYYEIHGTGDVCLMGTRRALRVVRYFDRDDAKNAKLRARGPRISPSIERGHLLDILQHRTPAVTPDSIFVIHREDYLIKTVLRDSAISSMRWIMWLVAMFPANVHAARTGLQIAGRRASPLVWRLPLQIFWIASLWWVARASVI